MLVPSFFDKLTQADKFTSKLVGLCYSFAGRHSEPGSFASLADGDKK